MPVVIIKCRQFPLTRHSIVQPQQDRAFQPQLQVRQIGRITHRLNNDTLSARVALHVTSTMELQKLVPKCPIRISNGPCVDPFAHRTQPSPRATFTLFWQTSPKFLDAAPSRYPDGPDQHHITYVDTLRNSHRRNIKMVSDKCNPQSSSPRAENHSGP